ncbi:LysM peptidoglycan-binding domain-containing protein [Modestobacter marinus]|uniref:LysM peptidoglycan-binding domain-containing protein n=1 Tax=Modestobacter marinus TaxID=477641 RepID=UPI001C981F16|nr:LysM domain-containing protein [Modestobacter marinus]
MSYSPPARLPERNERRVGSKVRQAGAAVESQRGRQLHALQRSVGNAAVGRLLRTTLIDRAPEAAPPSASAVAQRTHVVMPGETLQSIATAFGVTLQALSDANADKIKKWSTPKGDRFGFNAGETIVIPDAAPAPGPAVEPPTVAPVPSTTEDGGILDRVGGAVEWARGAWDSIFGEPGPPGPEPAPPGAAPVTGKPVIPPAGPPAVSTPVDVITARNADGTFSQVVTVNSTKRDGNKQLQILRDYCNANRAAVDEYANRTDWLKDSLDWDTFAEASLADESVWLPFFFALYYGGGGRVKSDARTLPLVASPAQTTWTDKKGGSRTANASPHIAGKAMDVDAPDLTILDSEVKTKVPEFAAGGAFPINSTQLENVSGQSAVHINFKKAVF